LRTDDGGHSDPGGARRKDSVGGTPTDAVETTALPETSLMIVFWLARAAFW
jgi:hypothetical protein